MSRLLCCHCQRPESTCICRFISQVKNKMPIIVLQHPNEVAQAKGSLTILARSLTQCSVIVGENFSENEQLNQVLSQYDEQAFLLYPHEQALTLNSKAIEKQKEKAVNNGCLILIDATWKKAYRMFMLSKNLHKVQKLQLPPNCTSHYQIRKTSVVNGLSTLEACCYSLALLENNPKKYQSIINGFIAFNQFLLSFRSNK
jgi:tRNA-uridine aminocarboxypropyltransferase